MQLVPFLSPAPRAGSTAASARHALGVASLDDALAGGLACGRLHEIYGAQLEDAAGAAGFTTLLAAGLALSAQGPRAVVWLQEKRAVQACGSLQGQGLSELGGLPHNLLFVRAQNTKALLQACLDAVRCPGLAAVILQTHGSLPELDLTASRRLLLAAERSGVTVLMLRGGAEPVPSAAETRWLAASAPSRALAANAPGAPAFDIELLRQRAGPSGLRWRLEWDRDRRSFRETEILPFREAEIFGAVVPVPVRGPAADSGAGALRPIPHAA